MSELTELEICKKIAEIEGLQNHIEAEDTVHAYVYSEDLNSEFNPLTDKALCFDLLVKHELRIQFKKGRTYAMCYLGFNLIAEVDENPQKAICLAIIAKHNKK